MIIASLPQSAEDVGILGHVEYTVFDSNLAVKSYLQTDNVVVRTGTDCAAQLIFGTTSTSCVSTGTTFDYIWSGPHKVRTLFA